MCEILFLQILFRITTTSSVWPFLSLEITQSQLSALPPWKGDILKLGMEFLPWTNKPLETSWWGWRWRRRSLKLGIGIVHSHTSREEANSTQWVPPLQVLLWLFEGLGSWKKSCKAANSGHGGLHICLLRLWCPEILYLLKFHWINFVAAGTYFVWANFLLSKSPVELRMQENVHF